MTILYLSGSLPANPETRRRFEALPTGVLNTPRCTYWGVGRPWAADNGCFQKSWSADEWMDWLLKIPTDSLFAVVPDVVGDHERTLELWDDYAWFVRDAGHRPAFVLQDGQQQTDIPADADCLFIGGSTEFKLSPEVESMTRWASGEGMWVHMGRVNSYKRLQLAKDWGCRSADGTFLAFGPDNNIGRMERWFDRLI